VNIAGTSLPSAVVEATTTEIVVPTPAPVATTIPAKTTPNTVTPIAITTDWSKYRNSPAVANATALRLPPAPARVTVQSLSGGKRTRVTALRNVQMSDIPITYAIISVSNRANKLLARIKVQVDPNNPTTSVSVPYASSRVKVNVQFANQIGISSGGPAGVNISEGNTFEWTTASGRSSIAGELVSGNLTFARGKSTLTPALKKSLKKMALTTKNRGGLVYVSGFAAKGEIASSWLLEPLARARAEAVSKYLAKIGVRQWITFHGTASPITTSWGATTGRQVMISTVSQVAS
jgi:outer membrane protein OmpA-like peptidoglycan-associated protein